MKFIQKNKITLEQSHEYILMMFFEDTEIRNQLQKIPLSGSVVEAVSSKKEELHQKTMMLPTESGAISITFINLGYTADFSKKHWTCLFREFGKQAEKGCQILLEGLEFNNFTLQQVTEAMIKAMFLGAYSFAKEKLSDLTDENLYAKREQLKNEKTDLTFTLISQVDLGNSVNKAIQYGECINNARVLGDIPNNYLHVKELAKYSKDLARDYHLFYEVLGKKELEALHSGGILAVNAGSDEEANLISIYYEGSKEASITALVGKGVMFDSGGYHLKGISGMEGMKYDMCGAANVLAALEIAVRQKSKKNILVLIPAVENVISPSACKMGDVLVTMSGKTVEVYNTDAEGRLILCDALTYAMKKGATEIIDLATLTYSCQRALGDEVSGIFSNNEEFYQAFVKKAEEQNEKVWRLPLDESYHKQIRHTQVADLINYSEGSGGGASIAACFLEEFVGKDIPWIHLDIVGTSVNRNENKMQCKGATGVLTSSIAAFLE